MKIDRRTFIKKMNCGLAGIIGLLGFAGCNKNENGKDYPVEYGSPHADYTVKGAVVNKTNGKPIKGIRVGYICAFCPVPEYGVIPTPYQLKSHVLTDAKGEFKLTGSFGIGEFQIIDNKPTLPVSVEDIDGEENGLFQSEYLQVDFSKAERSGKPKSWYEGEYTVNLNVELTEIDNQ